MTYDLAQQPLTPDERSTLAACEAIVDEGLPVFVNVANALMEIHQRRLYRETHGTFEKYVADRFAVSHSQAYRLIITARVRTSRIGDRIANVAQAQEVASLLDDPDTLQAVVERATELRGGRALTAAALRQARAELLAPEEAPTLRAVYEAAELSEVVWRASLTRLLDGLTRVPSNLWREWSAQVNPEAPDNFLRTSMHRIVYDAELTPEAVAVVWRLAAVLDKTPTEDLSVVVKAAGAVRDAWGTAERVLLDQGDAESVAASRQVQDWLVPVTRQFADRLALATIALRTVDPAPLPVDAEGDEAGQWRVRIAATRGVPWPPAEHGPMFRQALELQTAMEATITALRALGGPEAGGRQEEPPR